ncbi:MAG: exodeoxyribonuclease VII large subunit [Gammaproteobacteria bacterium]
MISEPAPAASAAEDIYSVTRLNREARVALEGHFSPLWIEGEVSNLARPASGHLYFSLKDAQCQVRCAMFRSRNLFVKFNPQNGMQVIAYAQVSLYEGRGEFQLIVESLEPAGEGRLRLAFEALKQRLAAEGLFSEAHKIPIPALPSMIGVVTSPTGAAIRDILSVLGRRFPSIPIVVYPVPVQGTGAAEAIARMIALADRRAECDVLIVARGGGSLEDLWAFNEEAVARAIYACKLPVVTGIGHEIDFTIADLVADRRAPTPSASAELVSPDRRQIGEQLAILERRLAHLGRGSLARVQMLLEHLQKRLVHPGRRVLDLAQRADELSLRLERAARARIGLKRTRIETLSTRLWSLVPSALIALRMSECDHYVRRLRHGIAQTLAKATGQLGSLSRALQAVSPLATLERGYAIVTRLPGGEILRDAARVAPGCQIDTRLARGHLRCRVEAALEDQGPGELPADAKCPGV